MSENLRITGLTDLCNYISDDVETMIEIGSYQGYSTKVFVDNMLNLKSITCIDQWKNGYDDNDGASSSDMTAAEQHFDDYIYNRSDKVSKLKMSGNDGAKLVEDESVDFVYIDACHTYEAVKEDIINFYPKVKKDGWIAGHDIDWPSKEDPKFPGVRKAVIELFGKEPKIFKDNSWIFKMSDVELLVK